jgi:hypothetical protein
MIGIEAVDACGPIPRAILICLRCDGHEGQLIGGDIAVFKHPEGYIGAYGLAMKAGWKDTAHDGKRVFFGPCCSGKRISCL